MAWTKTGNIIGPQGAQGDTGPQGTQGPVGQRGATWRTGATAPAFVSGDMSGDLYLDTVTGDFYRYSGTAWLKQGSFTTTHLARIAMRSGLTWTLGANADWPATSSIWQNDMIVGNLISFIPSNSSYGFRVGRAGLYRATFNINGGVHSGNLSVKMTRNSTTVGGNTVFSWSGTSSESAVAASGIFRLSAGDTVYPVFWSNPGWVLVTNAFGQAVTSVTLELVST